MTQSRTFRVLFVGTLLAVSVASRGSFVAQDERNTALDEAKPVRTIDTSHKLSPLGFKMAISRDGKILATWGEDGVKIWDTTTWEVKRTIGPVWPLLALSPDGEFVAAGQPSKYVKSGPLEIWSTSTGEKIVTLEAHLRPHDGHPYMHYTKASFSPDGTVLATATMVRGNVKLWDTRTWTEKALGKAIWTRSMTFSANGTMLAAAQGRRDEEIGLKIWDINTGRELRTIGGYRIPLTSIAFSPDSTLIAGTSCDGTTKVWTASSAELKLTIGEPVVRNELTDEIERASNGASKPKLSLAFSPDGGLLAIGDSDRAVDLCDVATGQVLRRFVSLRKYERPNQSLKAVRGVIFFPDGKTLLSGQNDCRIDIWSIPGYK